MTPLFEARFDLRTRAVNEHELDAQRGKQVQIVREVDEAAVGDEITAERDDEGLAAKGVDVGSNRLKPVDEAILARKPLPARRGRARNRAITRSFVVSFDRNQDAPRAGWSSEAIPACSLLCNIASRRQGREHRCA
jgi:hypothetical protein